MTGSLTATKPNRDDTSEQANDRTATCSEIIIGKLASISIIFINDFKKIMYSYRMYGANRFFFLSFILAHRAENTGTDRSKLSEKITLKQRDVHNAKGKSSDVAAAKQ